jgi:polysaccharide export outer membrane protein
MHGLRVKQAFYLFLAWCLLSASAWSGGYRVAPEDVLNIAVYDEPELSVEEARIGIDGVIALPLIGEVKVAGLTTEEIARRVEGLLADGYLKKPRVSVLIDEYRQFYVHGAVEKPGGYSYQDGLTVERAIVLAGGFTERASARAITLAREGSQGEPSPVGLKHQVKPGDVISVGESFF